MRLTLTVATQADTPSGISSSLVDFSSDSNISRPAVFFARGVARLRQSKSASRMVAHFGGDALVFERLAFVLLCRVLHKEFSLTSGRILVGVYHQVVVHPLGACDDIGK